MVDQAMMSFVSSDCKDHIPHLGIILNGVFGTIAHTLSLTETTRLANTHGKLPVLDSNRWGRKISPHWKFTAVDAL